MSARSAGKRREEVGGGKEPSWGWEKPQVKDFPGVLCEDRAPGGEVSGTRAADPKPTTRRENELSNHFTHRGRPTTPRVST